MVVILPQLRELEKQTALLEDIKSLLVAKLKHQESTQLFEFPDHLRKTVVTLVDLGGRGTAGDIAQKTGKARAAESSYLNQLVLLGAVRKKRIGRKTVFFVEGDEDE